MLWVAFDRGLRLAEKRCLPCPNRAKWLETRDEIYEDIMTQGAIHHQLTIQLLTLCRLQPQSPLLCPELRVRRPSRFFYPHRSSRILHLSKRSPLPSDHGSHPDVS